MEVGQIAARPLRVLGERLYRIDSAFPRVVRQSFGADGVPNGVTNLKYELELAACERWLIATRPGEISFNF